MLINFRPDQLKGAVDCLIIDPPFLNPDCQTKSKNAPSIVNASLPLPISTPAYIILLHETPPCYSLLLVALTARWLAKASSESTKTILVTGERMESLVHKLYMPFGLRTTTYDVIHTGLKNEFYCYANFAGRPWSWKGN
jgi:EEF1A lysine methyltransferase 1